MNAPGKRLVAAILLLAACAAALPLPVPAGEPPRNPLLAAGPGGLVLGGCQIASGTDASFELFTADPARSEAVARLGRFNGRLAGLAIPPDGRLLALTRDGALAVYGDNPAMLANPDDRWNMLALAWHNGEPVAVDNDRGRLLLVAPASSLTWEERGEIVRDDQAARAVLVSMPDGLHLLWSAGAPDLSRGAIRHMVLRNGDTLRPGSSPIAWEELPSLPLGDVQSFAAYRRNADLAVVAVTPHPLRDGPPEVRARLWRDGVWQGKDEFSPPRRLDGGLVSALAGTAPEAWLEAFLITGDGGLRLSSRPIGPGQRARAEPGRLEREAEALPPFAGGNALTDLSGLVSLGILLAFVALLVLQSRRSRLLSRLFPGRPPDLFSRGVALAIDWLLVSIGMAAYHIASGDMRILAEIMTLGEATFLFWINLAAFIVYATLLEGLYGSTPGKRLTGMRVRSVLGGRPGFLQALFRNMMRCVDMYPLLFPGGLGALAAMFNIRRQRVGDLLAATVVRRHLPYRFRTFLLASASPRRLELMEALGVRIRVEAMHIAEDAVSGDTPPDTAQMLATAKARAAACRTTEAMEIVVAADTMVVVDGEILGKPVDAADASRMLNLLSGRSHSVYTGVMIWDPVTGQGLSDVEQTEVEFRRLSQREIDDYIATGDPMDKAGAYGVQTGSLVKEIRGSLSNVAGLPMEMLQDMLARLDS